MQPYRSSIITDRPCAFTGKNPRQPTSMIAALTPRPTAARSPRQTAMQPAEDLPTKTSLILSTRHYPICGLCGGHFRQRRLEGGGVLFAAGARFRHAPDRHDFRDLLSQPCVRHEPCVCEYFEERVIPAVPILDPCVGRVVRGLLRANSLWNLISERHSLCFGTEPDGDKADYIRGGCCTGCSRKGPECGEEQADG